MMINPPSYLFKYRTITEQSLAMLSTNQLYFANYRSFNDPFDCQVARFEYPPTPVAVAERGESVIRVCCLTAIPDNLLMWAHYAAAHTGFCIRYAVGAHRESRAMCFPVDYQLEFPKLAADSTENFVNVLLTKSKDWEYEREWRMISHVPEGHGDSGMVYEHPPDLLSGIVFGMRISEQDKAKIKRLYWVLSGWEQVETATVEVDGSLEVLLVAEAACGVLHPLDLGVYAFAQCVGNRVSQVIQNVL